MTKKALVVFTYRTREEIQAEGGSQAWKLNTESVRRCAYLVCTRNKYHEGAGPEDHHAAFLIGRISRVEASPERKDRYIVCFSEYAEINVPNVWPGGRNPIMYVDDVASLGIDVTALLWQPSNATAEIDDDDEDNGLSFEEARAAIGRRYGFPPNQIEIIIRG